MLEKLLANPVIDLVYRFVLWTGFSIFARYMATLSSGTGGKLFAQAVSAKPNNSFYQLVVSVGVVLLLLSLWAKESDIEISNGEIKSKRTNSLAYLFGRIASDLILTGYGVVCFMLGWILYAMISAYRGGDAPDETQWVIVTWLIGFVAFMGVLSLTARARPSSILLRWWYSTSRPSRLLLYPVLLTIVVASFWYKELMY